MSESKEATIFFGDPALGRHAVDAMNTTFRIFIRQDGAGVEYAVSQAFAELERLEGLLSRYIPDSDVGRINAMRQGQSLFISDECEACLRLAIAASASTGGYFDPCAGAMVDALKAGDAPAGVAGTIALDPRRPLVTCVEEGRVLDLGGIGKGFALDRMASILAVHGTGEAFLTSGASTMLAVGQASWPVDLAMENGMRRLALSRGALAASGHSQQGVHIVDPADGGAAGYYHHVWVRHAQAALADAYATACYAMPPAALENFARGLPPECDVICDPVVGR